MNKRKLLWLMLIILLGFILTACSSANATPPPPTPTPTPSPDQVIAGAISQGDITTAVVAFVGWQSGMAILATIIIVMIGFKIANRSSRPEVLMMVLFVAIVGAALISKSGWLWLISIIVAGMYVAYLFFSNKYTLRRARFTSSGRQSNSKSGESRSSSITNDEYALTPLAIPLTSSEVLAAQVGQQFDSMYNTGDPNDGDSMY